MNSNIFDAVCFASNEVFVVCTYCNVLVAELSSVYIYYCTLVARIGVCSCTVVRIVCAYIESNAVPRLADVLINCTGVKATKDLKYAKIYLSILDDDPKVKETCLKLIKEAKAFIRNQLKDLMSIRNIPDLIFELDNSAVYGSKIDEILKEISKDERTDN